MSARPISAPELAEPAPLAGLVRALRAFLGARCSLAAADRELHGHGESYHPTAAPDVVCYAQSTDEVSAIVSLCRTARVPIVPFGAGTSLEGHVAALHGGVCIDLSRMNAIVAVHAEDLDCVVQAGVTRQQLNAHLRDTGLFFPVDPGAEATLGGMAATRASGTNAVRYGTMRENVIALTAVLADGSVVKTANRARKSAAGYDLTRLFVGSEGTLGVITEVTLRLQGIPEAISVAVCSFPDVGSAVSCAIETVQAGIAVARIELLDDLCMCAINRYNGLSYPETATLFLEFHGSGSEVEDQAASVRDIAEGHGGSGWRHAAGADERARLWQARHNLHYALLALRPGAKIWGTDACVPISQLATCITEIRAETEKAGFPVPALGHVGDGNFHLSFIIDLDDPAELREAERLNGLLVNRAIALGGTCTGEHGVGYGKAKYLRREHGDAAVDLMRLIKTSLDPHNILNPGKVLPA
ncbi:FAD-binding oxidoreductase [Bosea sp. PAMC 26642]|uniref:FAD-binding oxidoreductase n=1 Tax=Bosea sp. (strain PAMC 26642) TaxID=1792307 RepID=UPI0012E84982|nr:FAD-linked oxidase C-terminal domain-containing protein [Bosea sp. PAMC 26642]